MATVRFVPNPRLAAELAHSDAMRKVMLEHAERAADAARAVAPVDTGAFKDSIQAAPTETGARVLTDDPIGNLKEFGSIHNPPSFALRRGVESTVGPVR